MEKLIIISTTGGVPKYLEEILQSQSVDQNIIRLCFEKSGFLFNEYEKIFTEIFVRKSKTMEKIVHAIYEKKLTPVQLAKKLKTTISSSFSENIRILEISGFISRDYSFKPDGTVSGLSYLRLKDNYLRFYLKYIEPNKLQIEKGGKKIKPLTELLQYESIMGLQFENLLLHNRNLILKALGIDDHLVITAAPYSQRSTSRNKGGCQIDLLIHTKLDVFYLCEFKCKKTITQQIIKEVRDKENKISLPKRASIKTVLIYEGELHHESLDQITNYFFKTISFKELFQIHS